MERVKLLMQLGGCLDTKRGGGIGGGIGAVNVATANSSTRVSTAAVAKSSNAWNVAKSIYYDEGILAFWRGENIIM